MTRIATLNVNGVNGRLPVLLRWLDEAKCDIVCLQELKTSDEKFPLDAISNAGYGAIWHGQKSYNGVAILARGTDPVERRRGLPGDPDDTHSRYIEADVNGLVIGCLYLPNVNPAPGPKFDYKLGWFERLISYGQSLLEAGGPTVLCGDYSRMLAGGWIDAVRHTHPENAIYTYWNFSYRGGYDRSSGLRMDHLLVGPSLSSHLRSAGVDVETRGWEKPSDHAPAWIEIDEQNGRS